MANVFENRLSSAVLSGPTSKKYAETSSERRVKITPKNPYEPLLKPDNGFVVSIPQTPRNQGELIVWIDQSNDPEGRAEMYCAVEVNGVLDWYVVYMGTIALSTSPTTP